MTDPIGGRRSRPLPIARATVADLHALLMAQLRDLVHRIARANSDIPNNFGISIVTPSRHPRGPRKHAGTMSSPY